MACRLHSNTTQTDRNAIMADVYHPPLFARAHRTPHGPIEEPPEPDEQGPIDPDDGESDEPAESPERPRPPGKLGRVCATSNLLKHRVLSF
jgi:hypothetical protein